MSKNTLVRTITERATATFGSPLTEDNWSAWFNHWCSVGEAFRQELLAEGLLSTAEAVRVHVEEQKSLLDRSRPEPRVAKLAPTPSDSDDGEYVFTDDHPVFGGYAYVVDGRVEYSNVFGTVRDLRRDIIHNNRTANEVRRCNMAKRGLF